MPRPVIQNFTKAANRVARVWALGHVAGGRHSRSRCMESGCKKAPEMECLWADGRGHAWFCQQHFDAWSKVDTDEGMPKEIVKQRKVPNGVVGEKYGESPKTAHDDGLGFFRAAKATGRKTGDGEGVGLFIPLPKDLAKKFPSLGEKDDSPSHVTFLYIGDLQKDKPEQERLVETLRDILKRWWPGARATLGPVGYFVHEDKDRVVPHVTVDFDKDLSGFRHRVKQELLEAGFEVGDHWPEYKPHVTLAYLPGLDGKWEGPVPEGSWEFDEMEVWGLPELHKIQIGPSVHKTSQLWLDRRLVHTAAKVAGWWAVENDQDVLTGDVPADHSGGWLDDLDIIYRTSLGRPVTSDEIEATFKFVYEPIRSGTIQLNAWFDDFVHWFGAPATEISWSLEIWNSISWFFLHVKDQFKDATGFPDVWETLEIVKDDLHRLNELEYPGDTFEGEKFEEAVLGKLDFLHDYWLNLMFPDELDDVEQHLVERVSQAWLGKVASRILESSLHKRNIALMRWLSELTRRLGVARDTYVVGGAVRNFLIDQPIKDIDLVIDSVRAGKDSDWLAHQVARAIPAPANVTTNQYGVAILTVKGDWLLDGENMRGEVIEIANARKESYGGEAGKGYKPHAVVPATIEEDVVRREFTVNTLLWRLLDLAHGPEKAEVVDLTGCGVRDLAEGHLRCPRDPDVVFSDDPTRILRAIKFTGKYGFKIPPDLAVSIRKNAPKMKRMPWEAIATILVGDVLNQPTARKSLLQMRDLGLLDVVSEMIREQKPFATYMANQLRSNRKVQLLLDLMDLGVPAQTPLSFLDRASQQRLRDLTVAMPEDEASAFVELLIKPPVDNKRVIDVLELPPVERNKIIPTARHLILQDPVLGSNRQRLTDRVIEELRQ